MYSTVPTSTGRALWSKLACTHARGVCVCARARACVRDAPGKSSYSPSALVGSLGRPPAIPCVRFRSVCASSCSKRRTPLCRISSMSLTVNFCAPERRASTTRYSPPGDRQTRCSRDRACDLFPALWRMCSFDPETLPPPGRSVVALGSMRATGSNLSFALT